MIQFSQEREIDLSYYGAEGSIILKTPTLRKTIAMNNEMGKYAKIDPKHPEKSTVELGILEILNILGYVDQAPFKATVEGILKFCDEMDERNLGSGNLLFNKLIEVVTEMKEAEEQNSPLGNSPAQETQASD